MTVVADAEDLHIDAAGAGNGGVVVSGGGLGVRGTSVRHGNVGGIQAQPFSHFEPDNFGVAFGMSGGQAHVLVEGEGTDGRHVQPVVGERRVDGQRRSARGHAQNGVGLAADDGGQDPGGNGTGG